MTATDLYVLLSVLTVFDGFSEPFVTGDVTATDWFIIVLYYRDSLCVNSGF